MRPALLALATAGCAAAAEPQGPWSYAGPTGPERWAALSAEYAACAGTQQSPVPLDSADAIPAQGPALVIDWRPFVAEVEDEGPTIAVVAHGAGGARLKGADFALAQFHFHAPAEHALDGRRAPMEVHFVHRAADGRLLVVGVLVEEGAENPILDDVWRLSATGGEAKIDPAGLLPANRVGFAYEGSLTTPPCSEIVSWRVLATPITASAAQIAFFADPRPGNARPLQALARRFVLRTP